MLYNSYLPIVEDSLLTWNWLILCVEDTRQTETIIDIPSNNMGIQGNKGIRVLIKD